MFNIADMITEDFTVLDQFISVPKDMQGLNCASLVGGIVEGMLDGGEFVCIDVLFWIWLLACKGKHPLNICWLPKNCEHLGQFFPPLIWTLLLARFLCFHAASS